MKSDASGDGEDHVWKSDTTNFQFEFTVEENNLYLPAAGILTILDGVIGIYIQRKRESHELCIIGLLLLKGNLLINIINQ
ncbi:hypothetical protein [Alteribacter keqinensis]|nr:hypothetical protein [Alteribacter keqinensis]